MDGDNKEDNPNYERPGFILNPNPVSPAPIPPNDAEPRAQEVKNRQQNSRGFFQKLKRPVPFFTAVLTLAAIVQGFLTYLQLRSMDQQLVSMNSQLAEMKTNSEQTDRLVVATTKVGDAAFQQADASKAGITATIHQSQKALEATIDISRRDQRAWISPEAAELILVPSPGEDGQHTNLSPMGRMQSFVAGQPFSARAVFRNVGRTPALQVRGCFTIRYAAIPYREDILRESENTFRVADRCLREMDHEKDVAPGLTFVLPA